MHSITKRGPTFIGPRPAKPGLIAIRDKQAKRARHRRIARYLQSNGFDLAACILLTALCIGLFILAVAIHSKPQHRTTYAAPSYSLAIRG